MGGRISKREIVDPRPATGNLVNGVSISNSTSCTSGNCSSCKPGEARSRCCQPCSLVVPANVSSSTTTIYRSGIPGTTCPQGWTKTSSSQTGYTGDCNKDGKKVPIGEGVFSSSTKLFIKPSIPFEISYNGRTETINFLTLYHPCPIRIENVQYSAVLSIGDASVGNNLIVLVPINSSNAGGVGDSFISRITQYAAPLVTTTDSIADPIDASTGSDWSLTQVLPVGEGSTVSGAFFSWNSSSLERTVIADTPWLRRIGWRSTRGPQYLVMADPISVNSGSVATILQLPATSPEKAIHPLGVVTYKNAPPKSCRTCGPTTSQLLKSLSTKQKGAGSLSRETIGQILMWVFVGIAMLWALSIGINWALDNVRGDMLRRWGVAIKNVFPSRVSVPKRPITYTP